MIVLTLFCLQIFAGMTMSSSSSDSQFALTPVKHVVIIMMENHSFDNVFGQYPTMNRTNPGALLSSIQAPDDLNNVSESIASTLRPVPNGTFWTANPDEGAYYEDWDQGKMDGFAANSGNQSMSYFGPAQLALEWDWAEEYAIGDRYFSSCLCQTDPNRLFSLAGYGFGQTYDFSPPPFLSVNETIFAELTHYGVSWAYYLENPSHDIFPLNYFTGVNSSQVQSWSDFENALQEGTLPQVSWVMPVGGGAYGVDQHPSDNVTRGEYWLLDMVNSVMSSSYWNSTAIFVTYDEGGGYYDHVSPPSLDGVQLGFRVPFFVISPYAKENYVSHTVLNHASLLAFIDYNWHLPALNQFVSDSDLPLDLFYFPSNNATTTTTNPRPPVFLGSSNETFPYPPQLPFSALPYSRTGSTNESLSSLGTKLYLQNNSSLSGPTLQIPLIYWVAIVAILVLGGLVAAFRTLAARRRRWDSY